MIVLFTDDRRFTFRCNENTKIYLIHLYIPTDMYPFLCTHTIDVCVYFCLYIHKSLGGYLQ